MQALNNPFDGVFELLLTARGIDNTIQTEDGDTLLMMAAEASDPEAVEAVLPFSDPNARDLNGDSALDKAIESFRRGRRSKPGASIQCIQALAPLSDVSRTSAAGREKFNALLIEHAERPKEWFGNFLLAILPYWDARSPDPNGDTPLTISVANKNGSVAQLLPFSDPLHKNAAGDHALVIAARVGSIDFVRLLLPQSDAKLPGARGRTALMECVSRSEISNSGSREQSRERLLCALKLVPCSNLDAQDDEGNTVLMSAIGPAPIEILELILASSNPNLQNAAGESALMVAMDKREERLFSLLLPMTNLDLRDSLGRTALMRAVGIGRTFAEQLLLNGAAPGLAAHDGQTALHHASSGIDGL